MNGRVEKFNKIKIISLLYYFQKTVRRIGIYLY